MAQLFAASADGQAYLPKGQAFLHVSQKAVASALVYKGLGLLHVKRVTRLPLAVGGTFLVAKAVEVAKGHRLGPLDTAHDLLAHSLIVIPLATKRRGPTIAVGLLWLGSCRASSPRWC